ncbi:MAG: hypothetical protein AAFU79_00535 [Myxococcota bacterium]
MLEGFYDGDDLGQLAQRIDRIAGDEMLRVVGAAAAASMQDRISESKTSPAGEKWRAWSPAYAKTRSASHSLGIDTRAMVSSIDYEVGRDVEVGATVDHAKYFNADRAFVGLSAEDAEDIAKAIHKHAKRVIRGLS